MEQKPLPAELRAALSEFQRYLSDQVAPLMVADSMGVLLRYSSEVVASEIHAWVSTQYRGRVNEVPTSDYLYHAMKKIHLLGEFHLVAEKRLKEFFDELKERVVDLCPIEDREFLRKNIEMLGEAHTGISSSVDVLHRQTGTESRLASETRLTRLGVRTETEAQAHTVRRMSMLLDRLQQLPSSSDSGTPTESPIADAENRERIISHAVAAVASVARDGGELRQYLENARDIGIDADPAKLLRLLSRSLPTWSVPAASLPAGEEWPDSATPNPMDAMRRIVSLAEDPDEGARRLRHLVSAAIEQFNEGSLGRAATMIDLAQRLISEKVVDDSTAKSVRSSNHDLLDQTRLKSYSESKEAHFLLRKVLSFFTALTPERLIEELKEEQRRDRRRVILGMLEIFGAEAREKALAELRTIEATKSSQESLYILRNLLYVLNRIPPSEGADVEKEIDLIAGFTTSRFPPFVLKESIAALMQTRHERAERILIRRLGEVEASLMQSTPVPKASETRQLLDRITAALSRFDGNAALRAVVEHSLKSHEQLGDARARITALATRDLTSYPDVVARIIGAIRNELPKKVLGFVRGKHVSQTTRLVEALSATPTPEVLELFDEIRQRFPAEDFAKAAEAALAAYGSAKPPEQAAAGPSLTGDLEFFGLPTLLQSLFESRVTGVLTLFDREGKTSGAIAFDAGRIVRCRVAGLKGKEAIFQLFEEAKPGKFAFASRSDVPKEQGSEPIDVQPVVFEALRRFDELREAQLIVPDNATLAPTGAKPVPHPREDDPKLIREVWVHASAGEAPTDWVTKVGADTLRIWRLLAFWVESGVLQAKT